MNKLSPRLSLISLCLMSAYSFSIHAEESKQTTVLGEITVTGEKFERSQSSTGSSTTVVTGDHDAARDKSTSFCAINKT
ncbi:hypothetical protein [Aggregatibacter kilianii]|uniref:hypothetical protein n=1 Tax=Aggregatibacter kilianii TaxID=2025884 RepID=UPI000D65DEC8|nr:hypothetical protein [Aggregatibacter kilianii]